MGPSVCPHCWGTTVSRKALAEAKSQLAEVRKAYVSKRAANKKLRGKARGMAGYELSQIGRVGKALRAQLDAIEHEVAQNKAVARAVGAAADSFQD